MSIVWLLLRIMLYIYAFAVVKQIIDHLDE